MTREEALETLIDNAENGCVDIEEVKLVFAELEQKPCEDAISRKEVLELVGDYDLSMGQVVKGIHALPPITPQPKMGRWKAFTHSAYHGNDEYGEPIWREVTVYHCNMCNRRTVIKEKYCQNCGCKMQEVEE